MSILVAFAVVNVVVVYAEVIVLMKVVVYVVIIFCRACGCSLNCDGRDGGHCSAD